MKLRPSCTKPVRYCSIYVGYAAQLPNSLDAELLLNGVDAVITSRDTVWLTNNVGYRSHCRVENNLMKVLLWLYRQEWKKKDYVNNTNFQNLYQANML